MTPERKDPSRLVENLIQQNPFSRNQIALMSGLTNTYLKDMEQGKAKSVKRDRLIGLGVALGLELEEIDLLLNAYDRTPLTTDDIPAFLATGQKMSISQALYPMRSLVSYELWANSSRNVPGSQFSCLQAVAATLRVPEHTMYLAGTKDPHPVLPDLLGAIAQKKKETLNKLLQKHRVEHFACRQCLSDYIQICKDPEELRFRKLHIKSLMDLIASQKKFHFFLADVCPSFQFSLKLPSRSTDSSKPKVWYVGKHIYSCPGHPKGELIGFATDNPHLVEAFQKELEYIRSQVVETLRSKNSILEYLQSLID